jgi:catalase
VPRLTNVLAHARGVLLTGTFTPSEDAKTLSSAPQFNSPSTPITVRFSSSTGIPQIPDTDPNANPRGIAIRFNLGGRKHTDIVSHSTPFFPVRTGQEFLDFLGAITGGTIGDYLGAHPKALAFVQAPKPSPESFATEPYFGVTALKFINAEGKTTYFRYQIIPEAGIKTLDEESLKGRGPNYLFEELPKRIAEGPASYKLLAQIAEEGDTTDDATVHWPEDRKLVELGTMKLEAMMPESEKEQKHMIFDPIPRVQGIEPSDDPLLELRAAVYLLSGRERRAA